MIQDPMEVMRVWWGAATMTPPFTPGKVSGGNDGMVRDAAGKRVADCSGFEARADIIAAALNYAATRQDAQVRLLCASLLVELGYASDPRLELKGTTVDKIIARGPKSFTSNVPRMLTLKEADAMIWKYMNDRDWDTLVADSLR